MTAPAIHIPAPTYHRHPRNYAAQFERWLGHRLIPPVRRVIAALEHQRAQRRPQRLFICSRRDDPTDAILRTTLAAYIRFRSTLTNPDEEYCVAAPKRWQLNPFLRKGASLPITFRKPETVRGHTFRMALILDADTISHRRDLFSRLWRSVVSCLDFTHRSLLIVLGTPHQRSRLNPFTQRLRSGVFPSIDLADPCALPPASEPLTHPPVSNLLKVVKDSELHPATNPDFSLDLFIPPLT